MHDPDEANEISLVSVWQMLLKRKGLILSILALSFLIGILLALQPRKYTAESSLQIRPGSANMYRTQVSEALGGGDTDDRIESEVTILQSKTLLSHVAEQLHLQTDRQFAGKYASATASLSNPRVEAEVVGRMRKTIRVERTPKTEILTISCTSSDPLKASEIVNTLVNAYVEHTFQSRFGSTQRASKFLTGQLDDLKNQVLNDQKQLVSLQSQLGVVGFDDSHNLITTQLEDLARAEGVANLARITAEARYRILQDARPDLIEGGPGMLAGANSAGSSLLQSLRGNRAQLATQYASVSEQFGPNYPETRRLKAELDEAEKQTQREETRILEEARIAFEAAQRNQTMTTAALTHGEDAAFGKRTAMVNYQILLHEYQANRTLYEGLLQRLREAGVISGLESGDIEVVDLASVPVDPIGFNRASLLGLSLLLGIVFAIVLALIVESLDTSIHSTEELERIIGLPVLAVLPSIATTASRRAVSGEVTAAQTDNFEVLRVPQAPFSEGVRILRSSVLLSKAGRRPQLILVTSSLPGEGKSTLSANLACVLTQGNTHVLLIDADMRRHSQHRRFGLSNTLGFSSVLTGRATLEQAIQPSGVLEGLSVLTSGPLPPSPGDLLSSEAMRRTVEESRSRFDFILIDTPPSLTISDASILSELADIVVLVVRDGVSNKKIVRRTLELLQRAGGTVPGFVFNGVNQRSSEYYEYGQQYGGEQYGYKASDPQG